MQVEWEKIAIRFEKLWEFSNCLGAIDGKHVVMQAYARGGSTFFYYKKIIRKHTVLF